MRQVLTACVVLLVSIAAARGAEKIDLATKDGVAKVKGEWRYANVKIIEVPGRNPDGSANTTYSIEPRAQAADFDDSKWGVIDPTTLPAARSTGQVCFCWYRIRITAPPEWKGKKAAFYTTVDDYGEVWVNGKLPFHVGQLNGNLVRGHNVPNRVELPDVQPGKTWSIAIFGINGPISAVPSNWIFLTNTYLEISE